MFSKPNWPTSTYSQSNLEKKLIEFADRIKSALSQRMPKNMCTHRMYLQEATSETAEELIW